METRSLNRMQNTIVTALLVAWSALLVLFVFTPSLDLPKWNLALAAVPLAAVPIIRWRPIWAERLLFGAAVLLPVLTIGVAMIGYDPLTALNDSGEVISRSEVFMGTLMGSIFGLSVPAFGIGMLMRTPLRDRSRPRRFIGHVGGQPMP